MIMRLLKKLFGVLVDKRQNQSFLGFLDTIEHFFAKVLSLIMIVVALAAIVDLIMALTQALIAPPTDRFASVLLAIFGLFLNILIALEITQNITSYLGNHIIQIEMMIITSLIAVARKIIILDFEKISDRELLALSAAIFALSICYWLVR
jgi:uncharacterized membrane protein (DUF373 family)